MDAWIKRKERKINIICKDDVLDSVVLVKCIERFAVVICVCTYILQALLHCLGRWFPG